jgi:putative ABC transport system permease protein
VSGEWIGRAPEGEAVIPVSAEEGILEDMNLALGDTLVWDVQGFPITTRVASIRAVDWRRLQTNFFFVFPSGVLEQAPQFNVVLSRTDSDSLSAAVQAAVVRSYPNVSAVDLSLVLEVLDAVFSRISFVVRFMALFSVLTGLIVLAGAVAVSRMQRVGEAVLLKTLGASRRQVIRIAAVEYLALGIMAAATGLILSVLSGWLLAVFVFDTPLALGGWTLPLLTLSVVGVVLLIGVLSSRGVYRKPPLEVLREEA